MGGRDCAAGRRPVTLASAPARPPGPAHAIHHRHPGHRPSDAGRAGRAVAQRILGGIERAAEENRPYLLGCPAGRSAAPVYAALGALAGMTRFDLSRLVLVLMDEYLVEGPARSPDIRCCAIRGRITAAAASPSTRSGRC